MSPMLHTSTPGSAGTSSHVAVRRAHLQPAELVLGEQRQQPVVGVLADAPLVGVGVVGQRRVVEDPEQHGRVAGEVLLEPVGAAARARRRCRASAHRRASQSRRASRGSPGRARRAGTGSAPCSGVPASTRGWSAGARAPTYRPSLRSGRPDVSSPPHREPAAPCRPGVRHRDTAAWRRRRAGEELACEAIHASPAGPDRRRGR